MKFDTKQRNYAPSHHPTHFATVKFDKKLRSYAPSQYPTHFTVATNMSHVNIKVYTFEKPGDPPRFSEDRNIMCLDDISLEWDRAYVFDHIRGDLVTDITKYHANVFASVPNTTNHVAFLLLPGR